MNASVELRRLLDGVGERFRQRRFWGGLAVCWLAFAAAAVAVGQSAALGRAAAVVLAAVALQAGLVWWLVVRRTARDPRWVARRIEARHPDLSALLLTAVEQESSGQPVGFLQASVLESALAHGRSHAWGDAVPWRGMQVVRVLHAAAFAALAFAVVWLGSRTLAPNPASAVASDASAAAVVVEPGDAEIERGNPLLVIARFPHAVPAEANLLVAGSPPRPLFRSLDDPTFSGHVPAVEADLTYRVEFDGGFSEKFRVKVFEHPELRRVNTRLVFPAYTNMPPKTVEDVRHVTAVEGTEVTLDCQLNKPVASAKLVDEQKQERPLTLVDAGKHAYRVTLTPTVTQRYKVVLTDADGRTNKLPADISINVAPNLPPVVTAKPGRDSRVSPLEELPLKAEIKDDFGLVRFGLSVTAPDQTVREIVLGEPAAPALPKKAQPDYLLDFESMKAQPDQVVAYHFWAEDLGPDGKRRRASGDLYFAEVRHFEEIFRQGEQQTREQQERQQQDREQGQGGNEEKAEQLAEMQKQIVNATWKLIRRETGATPTAKFVEDAKLVRESQHAVIETAEKLMEKLEAKDSVEHLTQAMKLMAQAETQLAAAAEKNAPRPLPPALASEQAAYQALMKLRAREFEVTRQNSRQRQNSRSASNSRSPSQQQLRQLDLNDQENRYETQSAARAQQEKQAQRDREQRENQELADKLKELARRQNDLTDRVKELQSALEQAKDTKQKEELQQQLKRLRDQQQQALRDTDELQEKVDRSENREQKADAKSQLEQAREATRQAAEALEKGQLSQAVNEGTRAGRQLDTLREQLRKESANKFGEEVRELRQQARQLDESQQKLTKQLDEMKENPKPGLRDPAKKDEVQKGLDDQQKQFNQLTERLQKTVQEAEKPEPLLAQELFNTTRKATEQKVGEAMNLARQLAAAGGVPEAAEAARKAGQGTEQLRKGVEKAAESVLGGQTEALKRAQLELDELGEQVNREVAQATGQSKQQPSPGQQGSQQNPQQPMPGQQGTPPGKQPLPGQQANGGQNPQAGQPMGQGQQGRRSLTDPPMPNQQANGNRPQTGGAEQRGGGTGAQREGPIREGGFREWSDRMRAAEELIEDPQLRAEAARIRDRVRNAREEFKRHAKEPDWKQLQDLVTKPMNELRNRLAEEIRRREAPDSLVPIDRDPVPPQFADSVRRYYERLGGER